VKIGIHFIQEKVAHGELRVHHVPTSMQFEDIMTTGLPRQLFKEFKSSLCVVPDAPTAWDVETRVSKRSAYAGY
jgi:hypothetical protein